MKEEKMGKIKGEAKKERKHRRKRNKGIGDRRDGGGKEEG